MGCWSLGYIIGPAFGGLLADPAASYPVGLIRPLYAHVDHIITDFGRYLPTYYFSVRRALFTP